ARLCWDCASRVFGCPGGWFKRFVKGDKSFFAALDDERDQEAIKIGLELARLYARKMGDRATNPRCGGRREQRRASRYMGAAPRCRGGPEPRQIIPNCFHRNSQEDGPVGRSGAATCERNRRLAYNKRNADQNRG